MTPDSSEFDGSDGVLTATDDDADVETITFAEWRRARPFGGALLLVVGGLLVAWPSVQVVLSTRPFDGYPISTLGTVVGAGIVFVGVAVLLRPERARVLGIAGLVLASVSFLVAFGGYLVGMVVASAGGVLCFAWRPTAEYERLVLDEESGEDEQ
ncbi:DUF6114 domain-containing protein [Halorientalis sp.]|uniref:DUF6114 domain-containing protein n=1 Tax=Halorientalis sp. TaxID=1931229 RepID=UPI00262D31D3|nr:DUF6114 domain-containing protein [Halorientalis sp.]